MVGFSVLSWSQRKYRIGHLASLFSTNMAYLILSPRWPVKHWNHPQGAREETGNEVSCRGWKVWKQPGAHAISSFQKFQSEESEGRDHRWCLLFRAMFMMHLSRELQQGHSCVWRWFSCVLCQPWEKTSTLVRWALDSISVPSYSSLLCMRYGNIVPVIPGEISTN